LEVEDTNAAFFGFSQAGGLVQTTRTAKEGSRPGEFIIFRTSEFNKKNLLKKWRTPHP
jgi:hypothetical protein